MSRRRRLLGPPVTFFSFQDIVTCVTGIVVLVTLLLALELLTRRAVQTEGTRVDQNPEVVEAQVAQKQREIARLREEMDATNQLLSQLGLASPLALSSKLAALKAEVYGLRVLFEQNRRAEVTARESLAVLQVKLRRATDQAAAGDRDLSRLFGELDALRHSGRVTLLPGPSPKRPLLVECNDELARIGSLQPDGQLSLIENWRGQSAVANVVKFAAARDSGHEYFVLFVRPGGVRLADQLILGLRAAGFDVGWDAVPDNVALFAESQ